MSLFGLIGKKIERTTTVQGYLWKMKRNIKLHLPQWNKRWFTIEGRQLKWYANDSVAEESGHINLSQIISISPFESGQQGVFSFIIVTENRKMFLRADSASAMDKWIRILQMQTDLVRGGDGTGLVCGNSKQKNESNSKIDKFQKKNLLAEVCRVSKALDELEQNVVANNQISSMRSSHASSKYTDTMDESNESKDYFDRQSNTSNSHNHVINLTEKYNDDTENVPVRKVSRNRNQNSNNVNRNSFSKIRSSHDSNNGFDDF